MDSEDILEGNKLIRNFMHHGGMAVRLQYDSSWNHLMPVVETIESFHSLEDHKYINVIISQGYIEIQGVPSNRIFRNTSIEGGKINALYLAVIDFIKVYNEMFPVYE